MEKITCKLCNKEILKKSLEYHAKRHHNLTIRHYKVEVGEVELKYCLSCDKDIRKKRPLAKFCNPSCKKEYHITQTHLKYSDNSDHVECKICKLRGKDLANHIFVIHKMSIYNYYEKFSCGSESLRCKDFLDDLNQRISGEKNPGFEHGGRLSSLSTKFKKYEGLNEDEKNQKINNVIEKISTSNREGGNNSTTLIYWLNQGYTEKEAKKKQTERQLTFSLDICIEKHGEEEGYKIWQARQIKWMKSYKKSNFSKISQKLFWELYNSVFNNFQEIYFAQLDTNKEKDESGKNHEYVLDLVKQVCKPDFYIKDLGIIIEFLGDYWHGEKRGNKKRDEDREKLLIDSGYKVLNILERDYRKDPDKSIKECINFIEEHNKIDEHIEHNR